MPRRSLGCLVLVLALTPVFPGPARAASVTFDGEILRYRNTEGRSAVVLEADPMNGGRPTRLRLLFHTEPVGRDTIVGCAGSQLPGPLGLEETPSRAWNLACPLGSPPPASVRYRFSFEGRDPSRGFGIDDELSIAFDGPTYRAVRGVVYGGVGNDEVTGGDRVYGGPGSDDLDGARVYGGPGADSVFGDVATYIRRPVVLRGGPGDDALEGPGARYGGAGESHLYGGPGRDVITAWGDLDNPSHVMLVGGPGSDMVHLFGAARSVVVRVRGGGVDHVNCGSDGTPSDVLFVDRSDRLTQSCADATVLHTERPRHPYP